LPVLGPAMYTRPNVVCNFGHGQQGLSMASAAAAVVSDLVGHREPRVALKPYAANRVW
jgi:glycine/D-amino acid oxidase-like deaminating enzyme